MNREERFMQSVLRLARKGVGRVEPNPAVGCVIVRDGKIIGRGYHRRFGGPHAEIEALWDCAAKGHNPAGATIFVTLEPCCHHGKTGPGTEAILAAGIERVVAAVGDPAEYVAGKGFTRLRKAGIAVEVGVCRDEAARLNAPFFKLPGPACRGSSSNGPRAAMDTSPQKGRQAAMDLQCGKPAGCPPVAPPLPGDSGRRQHRDRRRSAADAPAVDGQAAVAGDCR